MQSSIEQEAGTLTTVVADKGGRNPAPSTLSSTSTPSPFLPVGLLGMDRRASPQWERAFLLSDVAPRATPAGRFASLAAMCDDSFEHFSFSGISDHADLAGADMETSADGQPILYDELEAAGSAGLAADIQRRRRIGSSLAPPPTSTQHEEPHQGAVTSIQPRRRFGGREDPLPPQPALNAPGTVEDGAAGIQTRRPGFFRSEDRAAPVFFPIEDRAAEINRLHRIGFNRPPLPTSTSTQAADRGPAEDVADRIQPRRRFGGREDALPPQPALNAPGTVEDGAAGIQTRRPVFFQPFSQAADQESAKEVEAANRIIQLFGGSNSARPIPSPHQEVDSVRSWGFFRTAPPGLHPGNVPLQALDPSANLINIPGPSSLQPGPAHPPAKVHPPAEDVQTPSTNDSRRPQQQQQKARSELSRGPTLAGSEPAHDSPNRECFQSPLRS